MEIAETVFLLWHGYLQQEVAGAEVLQHCAHLQRSGRVDGEGVVLLNENFEKLAGVGIQHVPQGACCTNMSHENS